MQVVFVDVMDKLIEQLQQTKSYTVTEIGGEGEKVNTISNYRAINSKTHQEEAVQEVSSADLVSCNARRLRHETTTNVAFRSPARLAQTSSNSLLLSSLKQSTLVLPLHQSLSLPVRT